MKPTVFCTRCRLHQFKPNNNRCRRCFHPELEAIDPMFMRVDKLPTMRELQRRLMLEALRRTEGSAQKAARLIGISKTKFYRLMPGADPDACPPTSSNPRKDSPIVSGGTGLDVRASPAES